ncbi:MAG: tRNA epoxyqueuosine(34) reductase QueG, partial [Acidimicrobiales bacterium]
IYGCDDCQEACPPNRAADRRDKPPQAAASDEPWVDLVWMLGLSDSEMLEHFERWYIPRRQARYLRRNALVALGNVGDGHDPTVAAVLVASLGHADPLVRGHAVWATACLGRADLLEAMAPSETDNAVLEELAVLAR